MSAAPSTAPNTAATGATLYTPAQQPPAGTALHPETAPTLFQPLKIRGVTLQNRFAVSPMCQYSASDGHLTDWHFAHLSQFIIRGNALTIVEATSVTPNGRISPEDSGLWKDSQIDPLRLIANFAHSQGQKIGIQLAHAGRKASTLAPWVGDHSKSAVAAKEVNGWPDNVWGPSAIPFSNTYPMPKEMTKEEIKSLVQSFKDAAVRAVKAGTDVIEIHGAHGYLISEFLSPISNQRTDEYGGSFENRTRLLFEVVKAVRGVVPETMPLFLRISSTEWMEWTGKPSWTVDDSIRLAKLLPAAGVDLLDVSSGGNNSEQRIELHPYYQVNIAGKIREELKKEGLSMLIGAVGLITEAEMARSIVQEGRKPACNDTVEVEQEDVAGQHGQADLLLIARQLLREPEFPLRVAVQLGVQVKWPTQYGRAAWANDSKISLIQRGH